MAATLLLTTGLSWVVGRKSSTSLSLSLFLSLSLSVALSVSVSVSLSPFSSLGRGLTHWVTQADGMPSSSCAP